MLRKYIIKYKLKCKTGLQIRAGNSSFEIGGIDETVVKDPITQQPYIPGSSLKGKIRSLLEWKCNRDEVIRSGGKVLNDPELAVCRLFGISPNDKKDKDDKKEQGDMNENMKDIDKKIYISRVIVRDAFLTKDSIEKLESHLGKNIFTEIKAENVIDRLTSAAKPRFFERVPKGAEFKGEMVFTQYVEEDKELLKLLFIGMHLLEDNYLGGSGSRGSGQVEFEDIKILIRNKEYYTGDESEKIIEDVNLENPEDIIFKLDEIMK